MRSSIEERKADHIRICLKKEVQAKRVSAGFDDVHFVHRALPEVKKGEIDLSVEFLGHKLSAPIIVGAMTGGTAEALKINSSIAEAVEELGLGMGVGSQRAALEDPSLERTFSIARERAPNAFLMANIGAVQLVEWGLEGARKAVDAIRADALAIHLNPLHEAVQVGGEPDYVGVLERIEEVADSLDVPIIVKETGAGIAAEDARRLEGVGVDAIDVAGAGGTSWAAVEYYRAKRAGDELFQRLCERFWDWGIPTVVSLVEVVQSVKVPVIASGGIRDGVHVVKALTLGASLTSTSLPMLKAAVKGPKEVVKAISLMIEELKSAMFLLGVRSIKGLSEVPIVITGTTAEWLRARGFDVSVYAKKRLVRH